MENHMTHQSVHSRRRAIARLALAALLVMGAARAQAQAVGSAAIRGRVADESGAGVPGATVTVSSPSLQLRERAVASEQDGEYQLRSLPLGTYTVTFELAGFQTIRREGIQLSAGFEARIDAVLKLSTVEETVTVSGQSPVIDVTTTTVSSNLNHELLDAIPTSRSIGEAIALAPGVRYSGAIDVGGNRTGQFANGGTNFGSDEQSPFLEGINTRLFEGGSMAYLDQRALDDIQVTAVGSSAEFATPGVAWTGVVKSGGNDFHGLLSYDGQYPSLQGNNVDAALLAQGIDPSGNSIKKYYDVTAQLGGKIVPDRLWFFGAIRSIKRVSNELGFFASQGPDGKYGTADDPLATRTMWNPGQTLKLSYQPATQHRFVAFVSRSIKNERERGASRFVPRESTWNYWYNPTPWKVEYQWTPTSRLMMNAMYGDSSYLAQWRPQDGSDVPGNPMTTDINTGFTTGPAAAARNPNKNHQINASMNYYPDRTLLGRHELRAGMQYYVQIYGVEYTELASGNYIRTLDNGAAYQIRTEDRPVVADSRLNNPNVFLSDTWRVGRRVTANLGVRLEHHNLFSRGGVKQASQFGQAATYGTQDLITWNNVAPRIGASWDIRGSGRSVLKGQWGRYLHTAAANFGSSFNPATVTVTTFKWHDLNNNLLYDPGEVNLDPNGTDFVSLAQRSSASGISTTPRPIANPDLVQPHTDETSLTFEQELVSNMAFRGLLVHKAVSRTYGNVKVLRPYSAWNIPITRTDPGPDGVTGNADDGGPVTFYDFDPKYRGAAFEPTMPINRDSAHDDTYKGFELTLTKRQGNGWMALGSFQMVKNHIWAGPPSATGTPTNLAATPSSPNDEVFALDQTWDWSGKLMGSYHAPFNVNVSALYNFLRGTARQRIYQFRNVPNATTVTLPLEPIGASRDPNQHVVNLKASRPIQLGGQRRLSLSFDVFNLFNVNTATTTRYVSSTTYGAISAILPPRIARVGLEFAF
jgi:hypothetical protein